MIRFLLDCLRPGRPRSGACERENSVELQKKEQANPPDHETKNLMVKSKKANILAQLSDSMMDESEELEEVLAWEEESLRGQREEGCGAQEALEALARRRADLKEQVELLQQQRQQQSQRLVSLLEEQEELESENQEYEEELSHASGELHRLQEEVTRAEELVKAAHKRAVQQQEDIGQSYAQITQTKQRLGELIAELIAVEGPVDEETHHLVTEPAIMVQNSEDIDVDEEDKEEERPSYQGDGELIGSCEGRDPSQEHSEEKLERPFSAENLKSSGSSSFTEITLTEVKEENASPISNTPQQVDSPDLEEEFETAQSLRIQSSCNAPINDFDYYHPDPFIQHDVFGSDNFPEPDVAEFLSSDPFKGTDPFASDIFYSQISQEPTTMSDPFTEGSPTDAIPCDMKPINDVVSDGAFNADINISTSALPEQENVNNDSHLRSQPDRGQPALFGHADGNHGAENETSSIVAQPDLFESEHDGSGGLNPESNNRSSNTILSNKEFDLITDAEPMEIRLAGDAGFSCLTKDQALCSPQSNDAESYTSSPDGLIPEIRVESPYSEEANDGCEDKDSFSPEPSETDTNDHKFGDIYFFTVRLDPGSPPEPSYEKKSELVGQARWMSNHINTEVTDRFDTDSPECENANEHSVEIYPEECYMKDSTELKIGDPFSLEMDETSTVETVHRSPDPFNPEPQNEIFDGPAALCSFDCDSFLSDTDDTFQLDRDLTKEFDPCSTMLANSEECTLEPTSPNLVSPEPSDTVNVALTGHGICAADLNTESNDLEQKEFVEKDSHESSRSDLLDSEACDTQVLHLRDSDVKSLVPLSLQPIKTVGCESECKVPYLISPVSNDTSTADSSGPSLRAWDPFSPEAEKCNLEPKGLNLFSTDNYDTKMFTLGSAYTGDPFSPKSTDARIFSASQLEKCHTNNGAYKDKESSALQLSSDPFSPEPAAVERPRPDLAEPYLISPISSDAEISNSKCCDSDFPRPETCDFQLSSHMIEPNSGNLFNFEHNNERRFDSSGSELDQYDPFSPVPQGAQTDGPSSIDDNLMSLSDNILIKPEANGETRSSSWDSEASSSPQINNYGINQKPEIPSTVARPGDLEVLGTGCINDQLFELRDSPECGAFGAGKDTKEKDTSNSTVKTTSRGDLTEIDLFCSELSKMVASHSTDSVQHCVAEMLFGSDPNTAKFYPWDFENSNMIVSDVVNPEADLENCNAVGGDLFNPKAGHDQFGTDLRSSSCNLLGYELKSSTEHDSDDAKPPILR